MGTAENGTNAVLEEPFAHWACVLIWGRQTGSAPMEGRFQDEVVMRKRKKMKYVHEGQYVLELEVELIEDETGWSPYISKEDAGKLDYVRDALRRRDLASAAQYGRLYQLRPVAFK